MLVYYIIELNSFFKNDTKDCMDNQSVKWGASLVISIEGILVLLFFAAVFIAVLLLVCKAIKRSWSNSDPKAAAEQIDTFRSETTHGKVVV
mmetsp:Transcript_12178/g.13882  ORF Transcript_12178/g.13882 Transcript_12178/m.13882 type:complete len:91 (+) Transcript_12178:294-566(+)